ncbi:HAD Haloacid dehalogenase-like hydrolase [Orpheovirus IHUMI-LCC2]|uniref:HAD Haloacid dehalogenase-like hydrolase n=1 Tax=Orpheovirus IHUMI-LCC2 TaxID=2023057 RepID=A0A2I2L5X4_9VIRU|nr:HAD Haloacid dehalogenase-like hydrolase [Orpheovirus IHUMI-LCC2]SNW62916.1 HAD Haloacid dehalogenase-like hydrolase [Orpheovirus IHUMI-LCC2]
MDNVIRVKRDHVLSGIPRLKATEENKYGLILDFDKTLCPLLKPNISSSAHCKSLNEQSVKEVIEFLYGLKYAGWKLFILSNNKQNKILDFLGSLRIIHIFDGIYGGNSVKDPKTKRLEDIMNKFNLLSNNLIFIDDNPTQVNYGLQVGIEKSYIYDDPITLLYQ